MVFLGRSMTWADRISIASLCARMRIAQKVANGLLGVRLLSLSVKGGVCKGGQRMGRRSDLTFFSPVARVHFIRPIPRRHPMQVAYGKFQVPVDCAGIFHQENLDVPFQWCWTLLFPNCFLDHRYLGSDGSESWV